MQMTGLAQIGRINMTIVILYTQHMCAMAFQMMKDILNSLWCLSIAFDVGNKCNTSYLDVQIWFCQGNNPHNLHVVALPMQQWHTGENMFQLIVTFFDALLSNWKGKLIGISSDSASNMTVAFSGVVTHLQKLALPGLYHIWWFGCPKGNCFFMWQEFCVKCNGYHWTFALQSKPYFRNAVQMSKICQYLLVVNGTTSSEYQKQLISKVISFSSSLFLDIDSYILLYYIFLLVFFILNFL